MNHKKIVLTEFSVSHSEILHTVVRFLDSSEFEVHIWLNKDADFDKTFLTDNIKLNLKKNNSILSNITFTVGLIFYVLKNGIKYVYINTAHGLLVRNFCILSTLFSYQVIGLAHHGEKMKGSKTQNIISLKIKKYFVLSEFIKKNLLNEHKNKLKITDFYPIFLSNPLENEFGEFSKLIICIPGEISDKRKNYEVLLKNVRIYKDKLNNKVLFDVLGTLKYEWNYKYIAEMKSDEFKGLFITYEGYIKNDYFVKRISKCDVILPLIMPGVENFENYLRYQISGAYNMAYIFKKPLLLHESFKDFDEFRDISFFYNEFNLGAVISGLIQKKQDVIKLRENIINSKRLDFEYQRKKFIEFIND